MAGEYQDPFEAFKRKKKEEESKSKQELNKEQGFLELDQERPKGFTTNRYDRKKLFVPSPPSAEKPAEKPEEEQIFFSDEAEMISDTDKPKGFLRHHQKAKKPPKPGELEKPDGFESHKWK